MGQNVKMITESNFESEVLGASGPVLVDFYTTWCGPCKMLTPIVEKLADEYAGKLTVAKVDVDGAPNLAAKYGITSVPTIIVFEAGKKKASHTGLANRQKLIEMAGLS
jgi:thioredoxin 1